MQPEEPATSTELQDQPDADKSAQQHRGVIRAAGIIGLMTILSRVLGLWRFRLMAGIFGASAVADAFNFAFVFPNLTRRLFGEGAMTSAFVPVFSDRLAKDQHEAASRTGSVLLCKLSYWLSLACIAAMALSAVLRIALPHVTPNAPRYILDLKLFEAMLPYMVFINVAAVLMGILNAMGHFWMPAFAPVLLNVFMIAACKWALPYFGEQAHEQIWAVAIAVLIGGAAQVLIQIPPAIMRGFRFRFSMDSTDPGYLEVLANFKPVMLLVAVFQINVLLDNIIAQVFISGSGPVTYLNMGTSIYQLPWSIFSLALGTAALPALSKFWALKREDEFVKTLLSSLRMVIFLAVPCTVGIMILSEDLVRLLYGTGRFMENDGEPIKRTAGVVMFSSLGLVFFSVNALLARALYAMKDMKTPTTTSAKSILINIVLNLVFVLCTPMRESGIALASTLSNAWQTWLLVEAVRRQLGQVGGGHDSKFKDFILRVGGAAVFSAAAGAAGYYYFSMKHDWAGSWPILSEGFFAFFAAAALSLVPFWLISKPYFVQQLSDKPLVPEGTLQAPYGVKDELWPEELKFKHSLYTTAIASAIMGFMVWAIRDSLPPEGHSMVLMFQRATIPVAAGVIVYAMAASGLLAREYNELKTAFVVKLKIRPF